MGAYLRRPRVGHGLAYTVRTQRARTEYLLSLDELKTIAGS